MLFDKKIGVSFRYIYIYIYIYIYTCIYMYIYIYSILGPVKPVLGVIPSGQEIIHE